jgi:hypothetical protein
MLAGHLQKDKALIEYNQLSEAEDGVDALSRVKKKCVNDVTAAAGDQEAVEGLKSEIEREAPEMLPH